MQAHGARHGLRGAYGTIPIGLSHPLARPMEVWINPPKALVRSHAASNTRLPDLPTRTPSRSLPSIVTVVTL